MFSPNLKSLGLGLVILGLPLCLRAKTATIEEHWSITLPDTWKVSQEFHELTLADLYSFGQDIDTQYRDPHMMAMMAKGTRRADEPCLNEGFSLLFMDGPTDTFIAGDWSPIQLELFGKKQSASVCTVTRPHAKLLRYAVLLNSSDLPGYSAELNNRRVVLYLTLREESDLKIYLHTLDTLARLPPPSS